MRRNKCGIGEAAPPAVPDDKEEREERDADRDTDREEAQDCDDGAEECFMFDARCYKYRTYCIDSI